MTEEQFAQMYGFDKDDVGLIKSLVKTFNGKIVSINEKSNRN